MKKTKRWNRKTWGKDNSTLRKLRKAFFGGSYGKESACKAGDLGLIPGSRRSLGEGNPLQNSMDRGAWWIAKSQTQLSD